MKIYTQYLVDEIEKNKELVLQAANRFKIVNEAKWTESDVMLPSKTITTIWLQDETNGLRGYIVIFYHLKQVASYDYRGKRISY